MHTMATYNSIGLQYSISVVKHKTAATDT